MDTSPRPGCIYIGQYRGKSLMSRLIRWRTWSDISHTAAFLPDLATVIEAWGGGVVCRPWLVGHTPGTEINLYRVTCSKEQEQRFYRFLQDQLGKGYDFTGLLGFVSRSRVEDKDRWFCSELIFAAARHAGIDLLARIEPYQVDPGTLNTSPLLNHIRTMRTP